MQLVPHRIEPFDAADFQIPCRSAASLARQKGTQGMLWSWRKISTPYSEIRCEIRLVIHALAFASPRLNTWLPGQSGQPSSRFVRSHP